MRVVVLNAGSSTLKVSVLEADDMRGTDPVTVEWPPGDDSADDVVHRALADVGDDVDAIGYRVVHGGSSYVSASHVDDDLIAAVVRLDALAPLHNRRAAAVMRAGRAARPWVPHIACFDTAFHASLPEEAWRYALPSDWIDPFAIRRYGFHGLSVAWSTRRAGEMLGRAADELGLVVAHLGSGCSVTAVQGGTSVHTSMGWTPFEGLVMGTRAGSIDPGILIHLIDAGTEPESLAEGLARRSGLLAIGGTPDVRELERNAAQGDDRAQLALRVFARHAAAGIAAAATALDRLDALVFTGGIGEHSAAVRSDIVGRLSTLGIPSSIGVAEPDATLATGPPAVLAVSAREDRVIARKVAALVRGDQPPAVR